MSTELYKIKTTFLECILLWVRNISAYRSETIPLLKLFCYLRIYVFPSQEQSLVEIRLQTSNFTFFALALNSFHFANSRAALGSFHIFHLCKLIYTDWSRIYYLAASNATLSTIHYTTLTHTQRKSTYGLPGRHFRHFMRFLCVEPRVVFGRRRRRFLNRNGGEGRPPFATRSMFRFSSLPRGKRGETHNNF